MFLRGIDKRILLRCDRPGRVSRIHDAAGLVQLSKNRSAKAEESVAAAPQEEPMFPPDNDARAGHEKPVPGVSQLDKNARPVPSQDRQALALKMNVLHLIGKNLIAKPANG